MKKSSFIIIILPLMIMACSHEGENKLENTRQSLEQIDHNNVVVTKRIYNLDFFKKGDSLYLKNLKVNNKILDDVNKFKNNNCSFDVGHYEDDFEIYILNSTDDTEGILKFLNKNHKILYYDFLDKNFKNDNFSFCASEFISAYINIENNLIIKNIDNYHKYLINISDDKQLISKKYVENGIVMEFYSDPSDNYKTIFFIYKEN